MAKKEVQQEPMQEQVKDKKQLLEELTEKAKGKGSLTYTEISDYMGNMELDKDDMDDLYDQLTVSYTHLDFRRSVWRDFMESVYLVEGNSQQFFPRVDWKPDRRDHCVYDGNGTYSVSYTHLDVYKRQI